MTETSFEIVKGGDGLFQVISVVSKNDRVYRNHVNTCETLESAQSTILKAKLAMQQKGNRK